MPRTKPTLNLGVYGSFDINPEQAVESFFESKIQNQSYFKKPSSDVPREGLQHTEIENEREFVEMSSQQEKVQKKAAIQTKINEKRIQEMYKIQDKFRNRFVEVNDFMKECMEKTKRAETQIESELEQQENLTKEIEEIENDLNILTDFEKKFKETIKEFQPYEDVFNGVIEQSAEFESFEDLMSYCDALMLSQVEIAEREQELIKNVELIRQKMVKSTYEAAQIVNDLNNELAELERSYNSAKTETLKWEKVLSNTKDQISENERQTLTLVDSINHLYSILVKRNQEKAKFPRFEIANQLDYIRDEIEVLEDIIRRANIKMQKEDKSLLVEKGTIGFDNQDMGSDLSPPTLI